MRHRQLGLRGGGAACGEMSCFSTNETVLSDCLGEQRRPARPRSPGVAVGLSRNTMAKRSA
jgi:hypothetical protein